IELEEINYANPAKDEFIEDDTTWVETDENKKKWDKALKEEDIDQLYTLIKKGAPYVKINHHWGPLCIAAFCSRYDVIKTIIDRHTMSDPNPEIQNAFRRQGVEALYQTCESNCGPIAEILLQAQVPVIASVHLHNAAQHGSWVVLDAIFNQHPDIDVDTEDQKKDTPLHIAAKHSYLPTIRYLLDKKADPNKKNELGQSALHLACINSGEDVIQLLVTRGANVNQLDDEGRVPAY
ncbi:ankyrin repeat domain-containing protein, partial [Salmonella sp. s51228]|uniref:ankyrin repeat domain-containing protein n=1 Tax=Salmonella sp. s51228 TaxID=3159652 RepID=UPI00397EB6C0